MKAYLKLAHKDSRKNRCVFFILFVENVSNADDYPSKLLCLLRKENRGVKRCPRSDTVARNESDGHMNT